MAPDFLRLHQLPGEVNEEWKNNVGTGSTVKWPIGLGGKGNDGIAAFVQRLPVQLVMLNMLTRSRTTWRTPN